MSAGEWTTAFLIGLPWAGVIVLWNMISLVGGVFYFLIDGCLPIAGECAAIAGWHAWDMWRRRPPRKRRESRVLGHIRDLGHRLVVSN